MSEKKNTLAYETFQEAARLLEKANGVPPVAELYDISKKAIDELQDMDGKPKNEANKLAAKGYVRRLLIALAVISRKKWGFNMSRAIDPVLNSKKDEPKATEEQDT